jgi:thiol-disulfide isomerase/thioredoxin/tetratricopeptide (TPR) repeat protein
MRKHLLVIPALLLAVAGFAQGIVFEQGTWKEVLEKAQKANKPIFVDVYTSWCGPCKMMSKNIFPLEEVGKVYNASYICYQVDAEKGEGVDVAKKYRVNSYPSFLYLKPDGTLAYRSVGSRPKGDFIKESEKAQVELSSAKTLADWEAEHAQKKADTTFLKAYLSKLIMLGNTSSTAIFDDYLRAIPEDARKSVAVLFEYQKVGEYLRVGTFAYENLLKNKQELESKLGERKRWVNNIVGNFVFYSAIAASREKDKTLLEAAVAANNLLDKELRPMHSEQMYMSYYKKTGEKKQYLKHVSAYANTYLMKVTDSEIAEQTSKKISDFEEGIKSGRIDTAKVGAEKIMKYRKELSSSVKDKLGLDLNEIAWEVFETVADKAILADALKWVTRSLELCPTNSMPLDTYANLLYRLGDKEKAIAVAEETLKYSDKANVEGYKYNQEVLRKMKANEKTWKE